MFLGLSTQGVSAGSKCHKQRAYECQSVFQRPNGLMVEHKKQKWAPFPMMWELFSPTDTMTTPNSEQAVAMKTNR